MNFINWVEETKLRVLDGYRKRHKYSMLPIIRVVRWESRLYPIEAYEVNNERYQKELTPAGRRRHNLEDLETLSKNLETWTQSLNNG